MPSPALLRCNGCITLAITPLAAPPACTCLIMREKIPYDQNYHNQQQHQHGQQIKIAFNKGARPITIDAQQSSDKIETQRTTDQRSQDKDRQIDPEGASSNGKDLIRDRGKTGGKDSPEIRTWSCAPWYISSVLICLYGSVVKSLTKS